MRNFIPSIAIVFAMAACGAPAADMTSPLPLRTERVPASGHSLTGSGKLDLSEFDLKSETYAFSVFLDAAGAVSGQIEIHLRDPAVGFHADATCLAVDGTSAWVGGVVTHTSDQNALPEGTEFWLRVQDNGQGQNADRISFVRLGLPAIRCNLKRPVGLPFELGGGNLQVR